MILIDKIMILIGKSDFNCLLIIFFFLFPIGKKKNFILDEIFFD